MLPESIGGSAEGLQEAFCVVVYQMPHSLATRVQPVSDQGG